MQVAVTEDEVLVVLDAPLPVEIDVVELAVVQRLRDAGGEVQTRHLLVADLGVQADELGPLERLDEGQRVTDRGQQDVAARLVGLGLDREADVVALVGDVVAEEVDGLAVALQRGAHILRGVVLGALAAAPHDEGLRAELGGQVQVAQHLAQGEATHLTVVGGEAAVLEHRSGEEVGGDHRDGQPGRFQRALQPVDLRLPLGIGGAEGEQVVVVEGHAVGAELSELLHGVHDVERATSRAAEGVGAVVADGPEAEGELVGRSGGGHVVSTSSEVNVACHNV